MGDRFIVFFDADRPISHFGWNGAFCGARMMGPIEWDEPAICPRCVRYLPRGRSHIFASESVPAAVCGFERDFSRSLIAGLDPGDPKLCDRCVALDLLVVRIGPARVSLWQPQTFYPGRELPGVLLPVP